MRIDPTGGSWNLDCLPEAEDVHGSDTVLLLAVLMLLQCVEFTGLVVEVGQQVVADVPEEEVSMCMFACNIRFRELKPTTALIFTIRCQRAEQQREWNSKNPSASLDGRVRVRTNRLEGYCLGCLNLDLKCPLGFCSLQSDD